MKFGGASTGMTQSSTVSQTRIGDRVFFSMNVSVTVKGSSTGLISITGLDTSFIPLTEVALQISASAGVAVGAGMQLSAVIPASSTSVALAAVNVATGSATLLTQSAITAPAAFSISGQYKVG